MPETKSGAIASDAGKKRLKKPNGGAENTRIAKAEIALEGAKRTHAIKSDEIAAARSALDRQAEETRWDKQKAKLEEALRQARE